VVTVKVAEFAPASTVTLAGGTARELFDATLTTTPPVGAGPFNVTVPTDDRPPTTVVGVNAKPLSAGGMTVRPAVTDKVPTAAVMAIEDDAVTAVVLMVNAAEVEPAATVTVAGGIAAELFEVRVTIVPPVGEGLVKVMVPVAEVPPTTDVGEIIKLLGADGVIVKVPDADELLDWAVMIAEVCVLTARVFTVNVALIAPPGTVTVEGTTAPGLLEDRLKTNPLEGAGFDSVTVPVDTAPPGTEAGFRATLATDMNLE